MNEDTWPWPTTESIKKSSIYGVCLEWTPEEEELFIELIESNEEE